MEEEKSNIEEELSVMHIIKSDGTRVPINAKTIYTRHSNGRVDCTIQLQKPLNMGGNQEQPKI